MGDAVSAHTPGPWSVPHFARAHSCGCRYIFAGDYLGGIAEVYVDNGKAPSDGGNDCPSVDEATANARLISAAPDLLAALKLAHAEHAKSVLFGSEALRAMEAAIAKAEGAQ